MRVVELRDGFGLDRLRVAERPDPRPGPGRIVLRVRAASLNYRDLLMVEGRYDPRQPLPIDGLARQPLPHNGIPRQEFPGAAKPAPQALPTGFQRYTRGPIVTEVRSFSR